MAIHLYKTSTPSTRNGAVDSQVKSNPLDPSATTQYKLSETSTKPKLCRPKHVTENFSHHQYTTQPIQINHRNFLRHWNKKIIIIKRKIQKLINHRYKKKKEKKLNSLLGIKKSTFSEERGSTKITGQCMRKRIEKGRREGYDSSVAFPDFMVLVNL